MFPTPIEKRSKGTQIAYQTMVPVALILWLLPLIAVASFSV
ncbi:MAG: carbohydrate ABC transporter permease, partial [Paracoccaceae bacterium]